MARADVFVHAARYESVGLVLLESLCLGTPVIAYDAETGGPRLVLDGGRYGRLLPTEATAQALANDSEYGLTGAVRFNYNQKLICWGFPQQRVPALASYSIQQYRLARRRELAAVHEIDLVQSADVPGTHPAAAGFLGRARMRAAAALRH